MARRFPRYPSGPYTPAQGAELHDQFMAGLRSLRGWRRGMARLAALVAVLLIVFVLVAGTTRMFR
jgi:hypothetical protein